MGVSLVDIGLCLPNTIPGAHGGMFADWARRTEQRGFASVAATERLNYPGHDPMLSLAAAAATTSRVRLMTNIVIGPLRSTDVLAKQAETLQSLSAGRFVLGVGPGVREDDFVAAQRSFSGRGATFDAQLAALADRWPTGDHPDREPPAGQLQPPPPAVPLMIAGLSNAATERVIRYGSGWTAPGLEPRTVLAHAERLRHACEAAGRAGHPRIVALVRFFLGEDVRAAATSFVRGYFAVTGENPQRYVDETPQTPEAIATALSTLADAGVDEVIFHPTAAVLSQVDRLADVVFEHPDIQLAGTRQSDGAA